MIVSKMTTFSLVLTTAAFAVLAAAGPASADPGDLSGTWSGGGSVNYSSGSKERARCRAQFSKIGTTSYSMNATCATASGKVTQSATLRKTGSNSYAGNFRNPDYNVTGSINVRINGKSQSVSMSSDAGTASFSLSKL